MAPTAPNDADVVEMLPAVLRHLADLRRDADLAESVFTAVRIQALRQTPVLPAKARILARVAALAISAPNRVVCEVCASACACLASCLARTESARKAACFLVGLSDALGSIRESARRGLRGMPVDFLHVFEREYVEDFPGSEKTSIESAPDCGVQPKPPSPPSSKLDIFPRKATLQATIALIRRTIAAPSAFGDGDDLDAVEQRYSRQMWESIGDTARDAIAIALSHPALLAGVHGAHVAADAVRTLHEFVLYVPQSPHSFLQIEERVGVAFKSHITSSNGQMTPIRSQVVVRLLDILRLVADTRGLCPQLWASVGIAAAVRGNPDVAAAAAGVVRDGFVANYSEDEVIEVIDPFLLTPKSTENPEGGQNQGDVIISAPNDIDVGEPQSPNLSNYNSTLDSANRSESRTSTSEKLLLAALLSELNSTRDPTHMHHAQQLERLCFLTSARAGLWRTSCSYLSWASFANRLLHAVVETLREGKRRKESFSMARAALEMMYPVICEAYKTQNQPIDMVESCSGTIENGLEHRPCRVTMDELRLWRDVVNAVIGQLIWIQEEPTDVLLSVDVGEIPKAIRILAQLVKEHSRFHLILPSDITSTLFTLCVELIDKTISCVERDGNRTTVTHFLRCYSSMAIIYPVNMVSRCNGQAKRLSELVSSLFEKDIAFSMAALTAMSHCICISSKCQGDHCTQSLSDLRLIAAEEVWCCCFELVEVLLNGKGDPELQGAAAKCLECITIHAPPSKRFQSMSALVHCVWHPSSMAVRRIAIAAVEVVSSQASQSKADFVSQRHHFAGSYGSSEASTTEALVSKLLNAELLVHLEKSSIQVESRDISNRQSCDSLIDEDPRILSLIANMRVFDSIAKKNASLALNALIEGAVHDFKLIEIESESSVMETSQCRKFYSELLFLAAANERSKFGDYENSQCNRDIVFMSPWLTCSFEDPDVSRFSLCNLENQVTLANLARLLESRMKEWLPLRLQAMLSDAVSSKIVAWMLMKREEVVWKNAARYALGPVLLEGRVDVLNSLSEHLNTPRKQLVEPVCAEIIAHNALTSPLGIDLRSDGCNKVIAEIMGCPLADVVSSKAGKIMLRLLMELGSEHNARALHAIGSLAKIVSEPESHLGTKMGHGELISRHFLLVMDAADRVLLGFNSSSLDKLRYLNMLQCVFDLAKQNLRVYVPKVFSTLKRCMTESESIDLVKEKTIDVWGAFLNSLGGRSIAPHLGSILAHLLPYVPKYSKKIVPALRQLFEAGKDDLVKELPDILLLLGTVKHRSLQEITSMLEKHMFESSDSVEDIGVVMIDRAVGTTAGLIPAAQFHVDFKRCSSACLRFLNVATHHESTEIRSIALVLLLETLRSNRHHRQKLVASLSDDENVENTSTPVLAMLVTNLTALICESKDGCGSNALRCLGELGAIDPIMVLPHAKKLVKRRGSRDDTVHNYPCSFLKLGRHLLESQLTPALWQNNLQDEDCYRLNRVGLAIQELLKACGCGKQTAMEARKYARLSAEQQDSSSISDGVLFWNSLSEAVQTAAEPYLLEPFHVPSNAKKFDIQTACTPVWSAIHSNVKSVDFNMWRRKLVVQCIEFIGGEGSFGRLFSAVLPSLKFERGVVSVILPHVLIVALDCEARLSGGRDFCNFVIDELRCALLSKGAAVQGVLSLLDILRSWRDERTRRSSKKKATELRHRIKTGQMRRDSPSYKKSPGSIWEEEKQNDPLTPIVDVDGREDTKISLLVQASAAFSVNSCPRAVFLTEQHVRNIRFKNGNCSWSAFMSQLLRVTDIPSKQSVRDRDNRDQLNHALEDESLHVLQRTFAALEDADSLKGIAALRKTSTVEETIADAEASGDYDAALLTYERALKENSDNEMLVTGFLRCLCTLGHWETMLSHATGLAFSASIVRPVNSSLQKSARSLGIEAAWRLGRWDQLDELCKCKPAKLRAAESSIGSNSDISFTGEALGRILLSVHRQEWDIAYGVFEQTRTLLLPRLVHATSEDYSRAYPLLVQLHILADVEDLVNFTRSQATLNQEQIGAAEKNDLELARMNCRSNAVSMSLKFREPVLSVRRACLEMLGRKSLAAHVSIELAQLARESGNLRAATAAASHALSNTGHDDAVIFASATEMAYIQRARGDNSGALLRLKEVISDMTRAYEAAKTGQRVIGTGKLPVQSHGLVSSDDVKKRLCAAHVLAGQWIEESRSESSEVVLWHYARATQCCPDGDQAFYALGRHYDSLWQAASATERGRPDKMHRRSSTGAGSSGFGRTSSKIKRNHYEYVPLIMTNFSKALQNGHSRLFEALPRLLTVWFDYYSKHAEASNSQAAIHGVEPLVRRAAEAAFTKIPVFMWMSVVPQLMSRILHSSPIIREVLSSLLARLLRQFPDQGVWLIAASSQLRSAKRRDAVMNIVNKAKKSVKSASSASSDSGRGSARMGTTLRKLITSNLLVIKDLIKVCEKELKTKKSGKLNCADEFQNLKKHLQAGNIIVPTLRALTISLPSSQAGGESNAEVETLYHFAEEPVVMIGVEEEVLVMSSLMQPRRVSFVGSDGNEYRFLAKRENQGDMRKDSRLMEFVTVVNRLLSKDRQARSRNLKHTTYAVIPLTEQTGMIEWVNDLAPLRTLVREELTYLGRVPHSSEIAQKHAAYKDKRKFLEEWAFNSFPSVLDKFFVRYFANGGDAQKWLDARTIWTRSVATWSMTGYIVGLGDRHAENILIEVTTGRAVHVDFAMLFEKGALLKVPEVVPFRLTPNMVGALGIAGTEGAFRVSCETALRVLRQNEDALMGTVESFVHDPLVELHRNGDSSSNHALETNAAVRNKLRGIMDGSGIALSVQGQVQKLIADATSTERLGAMYLWWSAWT